MTSMVWMWRSLLVKVCLTEVYWKQQYPSKIANPHLCRENHCNLSSIYQTPCNLKLLANILSVANCINLTNSCTTLKVYLLVTSIDKIITFSLVKYFNVVVTTKIASFWCRQLTTESIFADTNIVFAYNQSIQKNWIRHQVGWCLLSSSSHLSIIDDFFETSKSPALGTITRGLGITVVS